MDLLSELVPPGTSLWDALWPALVIALLRIGDVTLNVFKTVFMVSGRRVLASLFHAVEAGVWLSAAGIVFADMTPLRALGFVVGVAAGTYLGMIIIQKLRMGMVTVRVYVDATADLGVGVTLARAIHEAGYGATTFDGEGYHGPVQMILSTVRRRDAERVVDVVRQIDDTVFVAFDNAPQSTGQSSARV